MTLSCLRDSYCALNFNEKVEFYKEFYQNTELINEINALNQSNNLLNLATNNKNYFGFQNILKNIHNPF